MAKLPIITLLTDFGVADHYVSAMKGVILGIYPDATLVDISHQIKAFQIEQAAFTLGQTYPCFPNGTIHVVVVDPGVGSARRPLLLESAGQRFVGPDNGVLTVPMDLDPGYRTREITAERYFRRPVSNTFHGRDIFAPVAAWMARGVAASKLGRRISDAVRLDFGSAAPEGNDSWNGYILSVDRFGNLVTNFRADDLREISTRPFEMVVGATSIRDFCPTYFSAPPERPIIIAGSSGYLEISVNKGDASQVTSAVVGSPVTLRFL
jgi:S-adenosylmethionine hydrolase